MILALDIGNTNIKCAVFKGEEMICAWRMDTDRRKTQDEYGIRMICFLQYHNLTPEDIRGVIYSSVVPSINYTIEHMCAEYLHLTPNAVGPGIRTGVNLKYENVRELGTDRICNAVAAHTLYGGPLIFIDFGTATTFGAMSARGEFLGGAICPGLKLSSEALTERAAQLPKIELVKPRHIIARNTVQNMQSGLVYGYVGQVEYILRKMKREMRQSPTDDTDIRVIATGGMSRVLAPETDVFDVIDQELTLKGLRILYEKNWA